jgi:hypothetical protein
MTTDEIRAELRRAAMRPDHYEACATYALGKAAEFRSINDNEFFSYAEPSRLRLFFLLVAEAI